LARRVYLHIGLPKTGTTFIQTAMWHNRDLLRERGFLYPGTARMDHYRASQEVRGAPPKRMGEYAGTWRRLVDELADWPGDGLVSHEFFSMARPRRARMAVAALQPAEVVVVATVRSYVYQLPAAWQEALKMNSSLSFDEFMEGALAGSLKGAWGWDSQDIPLVLKRWSKAVPESRIRVVTVPVGQRPELLWERWLEAVQLDGTGFDLDVVHSNTSLGAAQAALLYRVKPHLTGSLTEGTERHRWVRQYFGHEVLVPQKGERFGPRPEHAELLRQRSQSDVDELRRRGVTVIGDLDDLVLPPPPQGPHPDDVSDAEVIDVAARAIEQMIRDVRELTLERDAWRARARRGRIRRPASTTVGAPGRLTARMRARVRKLARRARSVLVKWRGAARRFRRSTST
jgi:hypothetical protein